MGKAAQQAKTFSGLEGCGRLLSGVFGEALPWPKGHRLAVRGGAVALPSSTWSPVPSL